MKLSAWLHWLLAAYIWLIAWIPLGNWNGQREGTLTALLGGRGIGAGDLGFLAFVSLPAVLFWVAYKHNSLWFALAALTFDLVWLMMQIQSWWPSLHLWNGQELAACLRQRSHNKSSAFIRQPRGSRRHALHDSRATHRCANYRTGEPSPDQTLVAEKPQRLAEKWVLTLAPLMEELPNRIPDRLSTTGRTRRRSASCGECVQRTRRNCRA